MLCVFLLTYYNSCSSSVLRTRDVHHLSQCKCTRHTSADSLLKICQFHVNDKVHSMDTCCAYGCHFILVFPSYKIYA